MLSIADHITIILATLRAIIDTFADREVWRDPSRAPFYRLLYNRVSRAAVLIARLHALWQQGRLPRPRAPRPGRTRAPNPTPIPSLPRRHAWLVARAGYRAAGIGSQLAEWLKRPDMPDFLAAAPQAGRHLRPLCRMLGVDLPPFLQLPPNPPRPPRPRPSRPPATSQPTATTPDRPIPPYVLAATRAWRKKYG